MPEPQASNRTRKPTEALLNCTKLDLNLLIIVDLEGWVSEVIKIVHLELVVLTVIGVDGAENVTIFVHDDGFWEVL